MKERVNMTFDPEYIDKHLEYLQLVGLNRSNYFNKIIDFDVKKLDQVTKNENLTFNEVKKIVKEHFNSKIGEGEY